MKFLEFWHFSGMKFGYQFRLVSCENIFDGAFLKCHFDHQNANLKKIKLVNSVFNQLIKMKIPKLSF